MIELLFVFGSAALTIPFYLVSAVPFFGSERKKRSRVYLLIIALVMFRPIAQMVVIVAFGENHLDLVRLGLNLYNYFFGMFLWLVVLKICFKVHTAKLLYVILLTDMLLLSVNTAAYRIIDLFLPENSYQTQFELFSAVWTAISLVLIVVVLPFVNRFFKGFLRRELSDLPLKETLLLSLSPVGFYFAAVIYIFVFGLFSNDLASGFLILMGLSFSLFQLWMVRNTHKLLLAEMKHEILLDNYQTLEHHFTQIAQMKHEMRNHLFAIRTLFENGEQEQLAKYLSDIQGSFAEIEEPISCGNRLIQAIFAHAAQLARRMDFEIKFDLLPIPALSIPDNDIVSLFMNILNNALESCAGIGDADKRWINVEIKIRSPYLYLSVLNARRGIVSMREGGYISTKKDPFLHGHGIDIVRKIAKKHKCFVSFEHTADSFRAEVALPVE